MKKTIFILSIITIPFLCWLMLDYSFILNSRYNLEIPYKFAGVISGFFSALAFLGVIATLFIQKGQSDMNKKTVEIQRFETTFFNMLNLLQEIVNNLSHKDVKYIIKASCNKEYNISGRNVFEYLFKSATIKIPRDNLSSTLQTKLDKLNNDPIYFDLIDIDSINYSIINGMNDVIQFTGIEGYEKSSELPMLDHYFRLLYRIIKFVNESTFLEIKEDCIDKRYEYTSILRAMLSPYELVWIYYNGLSQYGNPKLKKLIEEYSLLKNLRDSLLTISKECMEYKDTNECINDEKFPINDYEFFLTDIKLEEELKSKYYLSAFNNKEDLAKAKENFKERRNQK